MSESTDAWFEEHLAEARVMAILRAMGVERTIELATTAWDLGIRAVEITLQSPEDLAALHEVAALAETRGATVGAGTIIDREQVAAARSAGARYLVSPGLDLELVAEAERSGLPLLPGVSSPTEVQAARTHGLTWLKAFPAAWLGTAWFRLIRGPFPEVSFVGTGGLDASNAEEFLAAGCRVVAVGSALADPDQLGALARLVDERPRPA